MNNKKLEIFVLKVLHTRDITLKEALEMTTDQLTELNLSRAVLEVIEQLRETPDVTIAGLTTALTSENEVPTTFVAPSIVEQYVPTSDEYKDLTHDVLIDVKLHNISEPAEELAEVETLDVIQSEEVIEEVIEEDVEVIEEELNVTDIVTTTELTAIVTKFDDTTFPGLLKKVKAELGGRECDLELLTTLAKEHVKENKAKKK